MNRAAVFLVVVAASVVSSAMSDGGLQASSECSEAGCVVAASSSLISIFLGIALALFLPFYPQLENRIDNTRMVGVWRRFGAFLLDFLFVLLIVTPVAALPLLLAEANHTGTFQWSFERVFTRPDDDSYLLPGIFAGFLALFCYFYLHARVGRQTIGQYVMGYRVVRRVTQPDGKPKYALRVVLSIIGMCMWPVSVILALLDPQKAFWWDGATGTGVARVTVADSRTEQVLER